MEIKFYRKPDEDELSVSIIEGQEQNDFDYIKFIDQLYSDIDSVRVILDDSLSE